MDLKFNTTGFDGLIEAMKELQKDAAPKVLRQLNRQEAKEFILDAERSELPYSQKSKKQITISNVRGDLTAVIVGPKMDVYWWRFVEGGTKQRTIKKGVGSRSDISKYAPGSFIGANRGKIVGRSRIKPLIDRQVPRIVNDYTETFGDRVLKTIDKNTRLKNKKFDRLTKR